jgi:hypothetical protein
MDEYILCDVLGVEIAPTTKLMLICNTNFLFKNTFCLSLCGKFILNVYSKKCYNFLDELAKFADGTVVYGHYGDFLLKCLIYIRNKKIDFLTND